VTANPRHGGYPIHPPGAVQPSLRYIFLAVIFSGRFAAVGEVVSGDHLLTLIAGEFSCVLYDKYIILCSVGMARNFAFCAAKWATVLKYRSISKGLTGESAQARGALDLLEYP